MGSRARRLGCNDNSWPTGLKALRINGESSSEIDQSVQLRSFEASCVAVHGRALGQNLASEPVPKVGLRRHGGGVHPQYDSDVRALDAARFAGQLATRLVHAFQDRGRLGVHSSQGHERRDLDVGGSCGLRRCGTPYHYMRLGSTGLGWELSLYIVVLAVATLVTTFIPETAGFKINEWMRRRNRTSDGLDPECGAQSGWL